MHVDNLHVTGWRKGIIKPTLTLTSHLKQNAGLG